MKQKRIKAIIEKKVNTLAELAAEIPKSFDKETIHEFRVTVKSLRAFLRLLQMHTGNKKIRISRKSKKLYDILGAIREAQLELEMLNPSQDAIPAYTQYLHHTIELQKCEWGKHAPKKIFSKLLKKLMDIAYDTMPPLAMQEFMNGRWKEAEKILARKRPGGEDLHTARKRVKDMLHIEKLAAKDWKAGHSYTEGLPLKTLDKLGDTIGKYNDGRIKRTHLNAFATYLPDNEEKTNLKALTAQETSHLATLRPEVSKIAQACIKDMHH